MKVKRLIWLVLCINIFNINIDAQISEGGFPPSFYYPQTRSAIVETTVPIDFYSADLVEVDNWLARDGVPMPVAKLISVDYTMENSGYWTTLPDSVKIWRLQLKASDAVAIMLYYKDFYIPEGGKLFIYSSDKSKLLGAYTNHTHPSGGTFATEFVGGDELILEYVASTTSNETPKININEIGYGYNESALREFGAVTTRSSSGSCEVNINCEAEGSAWQNEKKGVCYMIQKITQSGNSYLCSGSLVNNTAEDFKPYILTARHCSYGYKNSNYSKVYIADSTDMKQWQFYFHREHEGCDNSSLASTGVSMTGCKLVAKTETDGQSDGMLLLLNDTIPDSYDVFYNGWDRSDIAANSGACIHHPAGDYMKISTFNETATTTSFQSSSPNYTGYKNAHWNVKFAATDNGHGVTEEGSSGSPLYNQNKLIVGTLTGGNSSCTYTSGLNIYGKLSYHWNKFPTDSTRMDTWLDPTGSGVSTLSGRFRTILKSAPTNLKATNQGNSILLTWTKPADAETPVSYYIYRNNQKIGESTEPSYTDSDPAVGSLIYSVAAVYESGKSSEFATATISYVEYKAPSNLIAKQITSESNQVKLTWDVPVYNQTIYWGSMNAKYLVGWEDNMKFYYGQIWSADEILPFNERTLTAVVFVPIKGNTYEIYITQGGRTYSQQINDLTYSNFNTVALTTPFVIDGTKSLIVSIYVSSVGSDYPAVCDAGTAIDGKGNIYSTNGTEWAKLYDKQEDPDKFNYNFVVAAIVSSTKGTITSTKSKTASSIVLKSEPTSPSVKLRTTEASLSDDIVTLRSSQPSTFPDITKYILYRSGSIYKNIDAAATEYIDNPAALNYYYELSAIYDKIESSKSNQANIWAVGNENINPINLYPTNFSNYVNIDGYESILRVDAISIDGKICLSKENPEETINTSSLAPGLYFFRLYDTNNNIIKVVKCIKSK